VLDGLLNQAASVLERRFLKNAFLPVFLFLPAVLGPWAIESGRLAHAVARWERQIATVKVVEVVGYFAVVWFLAACLASQWRNIIRLFEGYLLQTHVRWLAKWSVDSHKKRQHQYMRDNWWLRYYNYPADSEDLLPTRLGNIIRAAERHSFERYRADLILIWPRLAQVMPSQNVGDVEDARATLEFLLVVALWCTAFAWLNLGILAAAQAPAWLLVLCFVGGLALGYGAYLSALRAAAEYAEQLRASVDLYRLDLLQRLKMSAPSTIDEEQRAWTKARDLIGRGLTDPNSTWPYEPDAPIAINVTFVPPP
jgi:hypothetical protein